MRKEPLPVGTTLWGFAGTRYSDLHFIEHRIARVEKRSYVLTRVDRPDAFWDQKIGFAQVDKEPHSTWLTTAAKEAREWRFAHHREIERAVQMCYDTDKLKRIAAILELSCASPEQPTPDTDGRGR